MKKRTEHDERAMLGEWIASALLLSYGCWLFFRIEWVFGTTPGTYWGAVLVGLLCILVGGGLIIDVTRRAAEKL